MYFLERIANNALIGVATIAMLGEAGREKNRPIDGANHFQGGDVAGLAGQPVAAISPMLGSQKSVLDQLLQDLRKQGQRDAVHLGDFFGAGAFGAMDDEVLEGDEPVVGLLG